MTTFLIILVTFWITCGFIHIFQKLVTPYSVIFPILDLIFSPYFLVEDMIDEYIKWKNRGYFDK